MKYFEKEIKVKSPLVIYHKGCPDGLAAAALFYEYFKDSAEYHAGIYQEQLPDVVDRDVYLLDFSYKFDVMKSIVEFANSITIIDHHKLALMDLYPLATKDNVDMTFCSTEKSGAMLAWLYLKHHRQTIRKNIPHIISYIQDRDLWKFELPFTKEISLALSSYPFTIEQFSEWLKLTKHDIKKLITEGKVLQRYFQSNLERVVKQTLRYMEIGTFTVPVVNVPAMFTSEAGNILSRDYPFAACYYDILDKRIFSLRSSEAGMDVSKIAALYGGGGHPHAAGFSVKRDHYLAQI